MEPTDLKPNSPDDAQLESWLRADATATPLPDDGFSARVLVALPANAVNVTHRLLVCLAGAVVGTVFAFARGMSWSGWSAIGITLRAFAEPSMLLALAVTAASLVFVFWRKDPPEAPSY